MCPHERACHGMAHCRHVVNTVEPSICGDNSVLCQITLTTCYYYYYQERTDFSDATH